MQGDGAGPRKHRHRGWSPVVLGAHRGKLGQKPSCEGYCWAPGQGLLPQARKRRRAGASLGSPPRIPLPQALPETHWIAVFWGFAGSKWITVPKPQTMGKTKYGQTAMESREPSTRLSTCPSILQTPTVPCHDGKGLPRPSQEHMAFGSSSIIVVPSALMLSEQGQTPDPALEPARADSWPPILCQALQCSTRMRPFQAHPEGLRHPHPASWPSQTAGFLQGWEGGGRDTHHEGPPGASMEASRLPVPSGPHGPSPARLQPKREGPWSPGLQAVHVGRRIKEQSLTSAHGK